MRLTRGQKLSREALRLSCAPLLPRPPIPISSSIVGYFYALLAAFLFGANGSVS